MTFCGRLAGRNRLGMRQGRPTRKLRLGKQQIRQGSSEDVRIIALHSSGFLMETDANVKNAEPIEILHSAFERLASRVVWAGEGFAACEFSRELTCAEIARVKLEVEDLSVDRGQSRPPVQKTVTNGSLGQRIQEMRKRRGYSLLHLASRLGISKPTLIRWERDEVYPRQKALKTIANELGTTVSALVYGDAESA